MILLQPPQPTGWDPDTGEALFDGELPAFLDPEKKAAEEEKAEAAEQAKHDEFERRRRLARENDRRAQEEAMLSGRMTPDAEAYFELAIKGQVREASDFAAEQKVPVVQHLLDRGTVNWIAAGSGSFKSFVAGDLAFRYGAEDMDYYGMRMTHGRALIVLAEGASGYAYRKQAWQLHHNQEVKNVSFLPHAVQLGRPHEVTALIHYLRQEAEAGREYGMVIIDTQAMSTLGLDENGSDMAPVIAQLGRIRDVSNACVIVVHHFGKDEKKGMRGSTALYAAADTIIVTKRDKEKGADGKDYPSMSVTLSTSPADGGKQKELTSRSELLSLEMVSYDLGITDWFGDPVTSLAPREAAPYVEDIHSVPGREELPQVSDKLWPYLAHLSFFEADGCSAAGLATRMNEVLGEKFTYGQLARNKIIELKKLGLVEYEKAQATILPLGVAVIAERLIDAAATERAWVSRSIRRQVSRDVSPGQTKLPPETSETSAKPEAKPPLTSD